MPSDILNKVVGVSIGLFVAAIILPVALQTLASATMTDVDPTVITVVTILLPVLAVIGIAVYFLPKMGK